MILQLIVLASIPSIVALTLCLIVGNAIPALIIGGLCTVLTVLIYYGLTHDDNHNEGAIGVVVMFLIPGAANSAVLLLGSLIYYLSKWLGG
jgi:hypothetical protein